VTNCLGRCFRRRVGKGVDEMWVGVRRRRRRRTFRIYLHAL